MTSLFAALIKNLTIRVRSLSSIIAATGVVYSGQLYFSYYIYSNRITKPGNMSTKSRQNYRRDACATVGGGCGKERADRCMPLSRLAVIVFGLEEWREPKIGAAHSALNALGAIREDIALLVDRKLDGRCVLVHMRRPKRRGSSTSLSTT